MIFASHIFNRLVAREPLRLQPLVWATEDQREACRRLLVRQWQSNSAKLRDQLQGEAPYALLDEVDTVVGFARLSASAKDPRGASWALITALVVDPAVRGIGVGRAFLVLLESEAGRLGYRYTCVWVDDALRGFYAAAGYLECEPQTIARPVLRDQPTLQLEKLMQSRAVREGDVCMRKRLAERAAEPLRLQADFEAATLSELSALGPRWSQLQTLCVPWERQVGPSCGLAALRMVAASAAVRARTDALDVLLARAKAMGASTTDGEMFDIGDLAALASGALGLRCRVVDFVPAPVSPVCVVVLPYDKGPGAGRPEMRRGRSAHYGVVVASADVEGAGLCLVVQHGASRRVVADTAARWAASNAQLVERASGGPIRLAGLALEIACEGAPPL